MADLETKQLNYSASVINAKLKQVETNKNDIETTQSDLTCLAREIANVHPTTSEDGFYVVDNDANIGMQYNDEGLDVAKVSDHFVEVLKSAGVAGEGIALTSMAETNEDGFALVDEDLNIGVLVDEDGIHAKNILEYEIVES